MITFTKEQLIASAHARIEFAEMMLAGELEPLKERTWSIELELARIALASLEVEAVAYMYKDNLHSDARFSLHTRFGNWSQEDINEYEITEIPLYTAPPAPASVPDDVSGPLAHAYKELTPTFMRNHIDVFERYGIYPDGSAGIQAMCIALDGMNRRAAMLHGAEPVTTANKLPMQPLVIDAHGTLRFKENPIVRALLDYATEHGYGLNEIAMEDFDAEDQMQLANSSATACQDMGLCLT